MSKWKEITLGDVAEVQNGYAFKSNEFSQTGIPVIKIKNVASGRLNFNDVQYYNNSTEKLNRYVLRNGDILISLTGSHISQLSSAVGKVTRYTSRKLSLLNQRVGKIYSRNEQVLLNEYLFYFMVQPTIQLRLGNIASGSANQSNISGNQIKELEFMMPLLSEQNKIASILSSLDSKIDLLRRQNKTLENIAQTLFKRWFIDFEFPDEDGKPYKSSGGMMVESELGEIPNRWRTGELGELLVLLRDGTHNPPARVKNGVPLLTGINIQNGFIEHSKFTFISDENYKKIHKNYKPEINDVVITKIGTLGKVGIIRRQDLPITIHCNSALLRVDENKISFLYLYYLCKSRPFQVEFHMNKNQTVQEFINLAKLSGLTVIVPNKGVVGKFDNIIHNIFMKFSLNDNEIQTLTENRDTLLPKLMSGQIRVKGL